MNLILLGPPGCGKGTQAEHIKSKLHTCSISTGELLRHEVATKSDVGKSIEDKLKTGELIDDQVVLKLLKNQILQCKSGFILDGFPRNLAQAQDLDKLLARLGKKLDAVIYFDVSEDLLVDRICNRYQCSKCGANYNKLFKNPKVEGVCDKCGNTHFSTRPDDNPATVKNRLCEYQLQTSPLIQFYQAKGVLHSIDAGNKLNEVYKAVDKLIL
jgi:adenylate kinase